MTASGEPRIEYVEARRVLLDALTGLQPHIGAIVLIGAQAVYLRTADRMPRYQAFTTDADLVVDPNRLADIPLLGEAMEAAGFFHSGQPGIWHRYVARPDRDDVTVPLDLIVPDYLAPKAGRRGARLPGHHGSSAAQKTKGVEGAVVDFDPIEIVALESADTRRVIVNVAGPAALLIAKAHKLGERLDQPQRLKAKDAGDVYRLVEATSMDDICVAIRRLKADKRSAMATDIGLAHLRQLFATPRSPGIALAVQALGQVADASTVAATLTGFMRDLAATIG
jgi:hypothetical protein